VCIAVPVLWDELPPTAIMVRRGKGAENNHFSSKDARELRISSQSQRGDLDKTGLLPPRENISNQTGNGLANKR